MTRDEAAAYIGERLGAYVSAVSRTATDSAGNLMPAIDDALRVLGYADADLASAAPTNATDVEDFRIQLIYRALLLITRDLGATFFDVTVGDSFKLSQVRVAAEKDLAIAAAVVLARFGTLGVVDGDAVGDGLSIMDLNYLGDEVLV